MGVCKLMAPRQLCKSGLCAWVKGWSKNGGVGFCDVLVSFLSLQPEVFGKSRGRSLGSSLVQKQSLGPWRECCHWSTHAEEKGIG
jgi:hypothetical protein